MRNTTTLPCLIAFYLFSTLVPSNRRKTDPKGVGPSRPLVSSPVTAEFNNRIKLFFSHHSLIFSEHISFLYPVKGAI